jgi:choline dehydrogenase-like flavoprotein
MFIDARTLPQDFTIEADVCIIGGGAAGITLARELSDGRRKVVILESGGFEYDVGTQALYAGEVIGMDYVPLEAGRLRFLGGSTNHWQGSCRPFDALDLADWPLKFEVLEPYYRRASELCQLGPYTFELQDWAVSEALPLALPADSRLKSGLFIYSPPTRFGTVYRHDLETAADLTVYLFANVVQIDSSREASTVTGLQVACLNGKRFRARARQYVLAAGGIENARLLLNSNRVQPDGLGNGYDLVGRYFMDHANVTGAATILADAARPELNFYNQHLVRGHVVEGYFTASDELRRKEHLPPFAIGIRPMGAVTQGAVSDITLPAPLRRVLSDRATNALTFDLLRLQDRLQAPVEWVYDHMWHTPPGTFFTEYGCGPPPDPQSRVTLGNVTDALGMRETRLDWRLPADFERTMYRAHELLGQELGRAGLGRLRIESPATTGQNPMAHLSQGSHHMGTTRMHIDPRSGVVDADARIHGIDNLFVAGSSVFPSYACDDPTFTIVALALRLSDHLKSLSS